MREGRRGKRDEGGRTRKSKPNIPAIVKPRKPGRRKSHIVREQCSHWEIACKKAGEARKDASEKGVVLIAHEPGRDSTDRKKKRKEERLVRSRSAIRIPTRDRRKPVC